MVFLRCLIFGEGHLRFQLKPVGPLHSEAGVFSVSNGSQGCSRTEFQWNPQSGDLFVCRSGLGIATFTAVPPDSLMAQRD